METGREAALTELLRRRRGTRSDCSAASASAVEGAAEAFETDGDPDLARHSSIVSMERDSASLLSSIDAIRAGWSGEREE